MIPGEATHIIEKIVMPKVHFPRQLLAYFQGFKTLRAEKTFYIKKLVFTHGILNDIIITNKIHKKNFEIFFMNNLVLRADKNLTLLVDGTELEGYKSLLTEAKNVNTSNEQRDINNLKDHVRKRTEIVQESKRQSAVIDNKFMQWASKKRDKIENFKV